MNNLYPYSEFVGIWKERVLVNRWCFESLSHMHKHYYVFLILIASVIHVSCDNGRLGHALDLSGENRAELEKVLDYFRDDPDGLKYRAAKFLIENMPYHYTYSDDYMDRYDSVYTAMSDVAHQDRDAFFKEHIPGIGRNDGKTCIDIQTVKADYLIKAIDDACDAWRNASWSNDYDESLFLDYVLPYRILNEQLSDWRSTVSEEYPSLMEPTVMSKRGVQLEAEDCQKGLFTLQGAEGASQGRMALLASDGDYVAYEIHSAYPARKRMSIRYTSVAPMPSVVVKVNGCVTDTVRLTPTNAMTTFATSRVNIDIRLQKGDNRISLCHVNDTVGVDYMQLNSVEVYDAASARDLSTHYSLISNKQTHRYLTISTHNDSLPCVATLTPYRKGHPSQLLRIDYKGYACWGIYVHEKDSDLCLETEYCSVKPGSPVGLYHSLNGSNQKWAFLPAGGGYYKIMNKDSGLFLEAKTVGRTDTLCQNPYTGRDTQRWKIEEGSLRSDAPSPFAVGSALSEALRVFDITGQYEWISYGGSYPPKASSLLRGKTGNCRDEADYTVYICRKLGIPAAVDFTPHWGNRSQSHSWSVLIKPDGKATPFYMGCAPCDTVHYYHSYKKPKVFRHRFQLNRQYASDLRHEHEKPGLFDCPDFVDVTDEYYETTDATRDVPAEHADRRIAYICVFDNRDWVPVFYGNISNGRVTFSSMGRGIVYMSAIYENGRIVPFGTPFLITYDGKVKDIRCSEKRTTSMKLLRKYPFMGKEDYFNLRMSGGRFQGANLGDFSDACTFYKFEGATSGNWYEIPIKDEHRYRYLRYIGPATSHCNINELEFYDECGAKIEGTIIGTEGEPQALKEKAFDGDILTGFSAVSPDGNWLGLKLRQPKRVAKLRFIPRNDGNCIEIGDTYELRYWEAGGWKSLGTKKATSNTLIYTKVPSGGLYVLSDLTKGHEERIFTYENGEQVWW